MKGYIIIRIPAFAGMSVQRLGKLPVAAGAA